MAEIEKETSIKEILDLGIQLNAKVAIQYVEYGPEDWTLPAVISPVWIERILSDLSVRKVRLEFNL